MKKAIILIVAVILALLLCSEAMAVSIQKSIVSADAKWVVNVDLKKFTSTRLYELLISDKSTVRIRKKTDRLFRKFKFDPLKDITGITAYGTERDEEKTVVCISGNFNKDHILSLLEEEAEAPRETPYGKYVIYSCDHDDFVVFVNNNFILLSSNEESVKTALDVIDGKKKGLSSSPMMNYVKDIPEDAYLMAVANDISSLAEKHEKAVILKKTGMASFSIMEKKEDMVLDLKFTTESSEDAKNVEQMIKGLIAFANLQLREEEEARKLLEKLHVSVDGNKIQIGFSCPVEKLFDVISGRVKFLPSFCLGGL